jgi:hypothetical protein
MSGGAKSGSNKTSSDSIAWVLKPSFIQVVGEQVGMIYFLFPNQNIKSEHE